MQNPVSNDLAEIDTMFKDVASNNADDEVLSVVMAELDAMRLTEDDFEPEPQPVKALAPVYDMPDDIVHVNQRTAFYETLKVSDAQALKLAADRIRERLRISIIETGKDLLKIKTDMEGHFTNWISVEFDMSVRTAWNYISVAQKFDATPLIVDVLPQATLYKLAAEGTPQSVRDAVVQEVLAGVIPTKKEVEQRIQEGKEAERVERQKHSAKKLAEKEAAADAKKWEAKEKALKKAEVSAGEIERQRKEWVIACAEKRSKRDDEKKIASSRQKKNAINSSMLNEDQQNSQKCARQAAEFIKQQLASKFDDLLAILGKGADPLILLSELKRV